MNNYAINAIMLLMLFSYLCIILLTIMQWTQSAQKRHRAINTITVVYLQITLLWHYFTLEITLGYRYEFKSILAISNSQA